MHNHLIVIADFECALFRFNSAVWWKYAFAWAMSGMWCQHKIAIQYENAEKAAESAD